MASLKRRVDHILLYHNSTTRTRVMYCRKDDSSDTYNYTCGGKKKLTEMVILFIGIYGHELVHKCIHGDHQRLHLMEVFRKAEHKKNQQFRRFAN
jgi:hypothetical protein